MLSRKAKNAEGKDVARDLFRHPLGDFCHPLKISLPPPGRNPETASDTEYRKLCPKVEFLFYHDKNILLSITSARKKFKQNGKYYIKCAPV